MLRGNGSRHDANQLAGVRLPIVCTFAPGPGRQQIERWRALGVECTETSVVDHARTDDPARRLRELVAIESSCCSFVDWRVEDEQEHQRLIINGTPEQLAALDVG